MAKRAFVAEDAYRVKVVADPNLSPDGRRVAFVLAEADEENDRLTTAIWVVPADGSSPARRFSDGNADSCPRWSPDGRYLAFVSQSDGNPGGSCVRLAPLEGGSPLPLGELPGPASQLTWAPGSDRVAVVCTVGGDDPDTASAKDRNAPRTVRGLAARLDGRGWRDGRDHVVLVEVPTGEVRQLTRGEFDHATPSFSPDGALVAFASDRHRRRDDRQFRGDIWVTPVVGGPPRRLTDGRGRAAFPLFSPDGDTIVYCGTEDGDSWDEDSHLFSVPVDGKEPHSRVAPGTDRGVLLAPGAAPAPFSWLGPSEVAMLLADRGAVGLHRVRLGAPSASPIVTGDRQIDGFAASRSRRTVVFTSTWPDSPSEVYRCTLSGDAIMPLTSFNAELVDEVELAPVRRSSILRPDGTEVEYFTLRTRRRTGPRPLHLDIHGGPHGLWPVGKFLAFHQTIAAAGYVVLLPNPRGSASYGQQFTSACTGDWGGADCEDILACCDDLVARKVVDGDRMFLSGASYGGFMTSWIVGHTRRFRAATAVAAVIDQESFALTTDIPEFSLFAHGGSPWERRDEYEKRSPLTYLPEVTTPVLVVHWEGDVRVPVSQGEELYTGLRLLGKETALLRFPRGFHIVRTPSQAVEWVRRMLEWNGRHEPRPAKRGGRRRRRVASPR